MQKCDLNQRTFRLNKDNNTLVTTAGIEEDEVAPPKPNVSIN